MKKRKILKRGIAYLLTVAMMVGLISYAPYPITTVQAEETATATGKTIAGLGTGVIADPTAPTKTTDEWKGSYVYFGTYNNSPVKYRVLDSETTVFGGTTMLLDCDTILWAGSDPSSAFDADSNVWADSDIRKYLNGTFLTNNFSTAEQSAIAESAKDTAYSGDISGADGNGYDYLSYASLSGEKIFFLDAKEATNTSYGYSNTDGGATDRVKKGGNVYWWLRSAYTDIANRAGLVKSAGSISGNYVDGNDVGVSPALNVNLSSVLFSSVISGTAGETGAEYKLTILDDKMAIATNGNPTRSGDVVSIPYTISGDNSGNATQVSILLTDKAYTESDAQILHYGALDTSENNGTGTFTLPTELSEKVCGTDYYAYIIAEDVNGTYETDYVSTPLSVTIPEKPWEAPTVPAINIGTDNIISPAKPSSTTDAWTGCYVYFGTYDIDGDGTAEPVKYRVLDSETSVFGGTTMLLDCDSILWNGTNSDNQRSAFDADSNVWADSDIRKYLNGTFLTNNFSTAEQSAIAESAKDTAYSGDINGAGADGDWYHYLSYASLNREKIFFLDAKEATNTSYGYSNTDAGATDRVKKGGNAWWWLRSAYTYSTGSAGIVYQDGEISFHYIASDSVGVSPALNVNLSSVLFSSASGTSKSSALIADSSQIGTTTGVEWKLTLADDRKTVKVTDDEKVIKAADGTITVPYTYTDTATAGGLDRVNQISVMITDKAYTEDDAEILYYGALQGASFSNGGTTGAGTFALPSSLSGILGTDYHIYILAEYTSYANADIDDNATDYASEPIEITSIYDEVSRVAITDIDTPSAENALDTTATVTTNATASVQWYLGDEEVSGNAGYNKAYTAKITLTANAGYVFATDTEATVNENEATVTSNTDGTITVSYTFTATDKGRINYSSSDYSAAYDGQAHGITVTVTDPTDATITYSTDGTTYSTTNPIYTDVGEYTVYCKIEKDNYTTVAFTQMVRIYKKTLTITAADQTITYGDSIDSTKYTVEGLVEGDSIDEVTLTQSTSDAIDNGTIEVSGVKIVNAAGNDVTANYDVSYNAGKLAIDEAAIAYTVAGYEGTYDGEEHSITVEITDQSGATVSYSADGTTV